VCYCSCCNGYVDPLYCNVSLHELNSVMDPCSSPVMPLQRIATPSFIFSCFESGQLYYFPLLPTVNYTHTHTHTHTRRGRKKYAANIIRLFRDFKCVHDKQNKPDSSGSKYELGEQASIADRVKIWIFATTFRSAIVRMSRGLEREADQSPSCHAEFFPISLLVLRHRSNLWPPS
jgi:hypothetical protein